jgi:hypothetical protein
VCANGEQPDTPARWRLTIWWTPTRPGIDGLEEIAAPIQAYLRWLDRDGRRQIWVRPDRIDAWPDDLVPPDQPSS